MIGIFDSGIGGLTVVKEIKKAYSACPIVYFGDSARYPWGDKSPETIQGYATEISEFLIKQGVSDIVIACNTASTFASDFLREKFSEVNFYDVITPVISRIAKESERKKDLKVGVIGTRGTIGSGVYAQKIKQLSDRIEIYSQACPLFVTLVEEGMIEEKATELIVEKYLSDLKKKQLDVLVLGCTHYPLLKKTIQRFMGENILIVSSAEEIATQAEKVFSQKNNSAQDDIYYFSDLTEHYKESIQKILNKKVSIKKQKF